MKPRNRSSPPTRNCLGRKGKEPPRRHRPPPGGPGLANAVGALDGLQLHGRVPPGVQHEHVGRHLEVEPLAPRLEGDEDDPHVARRARLHHGRGAAAWAANGPFVAVLTQGGFFLRRWGSLTQFLTPHL